MLNVSNRLSFQYFMEVYICILIGLPYVYCVKQSCLYFFRYFMNCFICILFAVSFFTPWWWYPNKSIRLLFNYDFYDKAKKKKMLTCPLRQTVKSEIHGQCFFLLFFSQKLIKSSSYSQIWLDFCVVFLFS